MGRRNGAETDYVQGVEPANNDSERALRHAVIWRKTSFGTQSDAGSTFVERALSVVATLRAQRRNVLDYLTEACTAALRGDPVPSLLPAAEGLGVDDGSKVALAAA